MRPMPVVALNKDAKLIGRFYSITEAAKYLGISYASLNGRILKKKPCKRILFVREPEYKEHWFNGTTDVYKFPTRQEINRNRSLKIWSNMPKDKRKMITDKLGEGRDKYNKLYRCKKVIHVETGVIYNSVIECANALGLSRAATESRARKGNTVKGITLKYYGETINNSQLRNE